MNEWILAGVVIAGSVVALGGGGWIMSVMNRRKAPPKA